MLPFIYQRTVHMMLAVILVNMMIKNFSWEANVCICKAICNRLLH